MSEADYGYDCLRLRAAREQKQLTVPEIAAAADLSERAVRFYLAGTRRPRAPVLPRLARAVGLAEPLDLCDLDDGERIVHLRVRAGKSRARIAADLGWHPDTYRAWELTGRAEDKMRATPAWRSDTYQPDEPTVPFFHRQLLRPGARVDGTWRPPTYGLMEYGNPSSFFVFEVPAERLHQAVQRTQADLAAQLEELLRD